jgi:hypothetical protein
MRHRACFLALLVSLIGIALAGWDDSVAAQDDGLSTEQLALVNRYFTGLEKQSNYSAYVLTEQSSQNQLLVFSSTGLPEFMETSMSRQETSTVIQSEIPEIRSQLSISISQDQDYTIESEVRLVEGVLYVNAVYTNQHSSLPPLPKGWIIVEDNTEWEGLAPLQLNSYVDGRVSPLSDRELLLAGLTNVVLESSDLEDGTSIDVIVMTLNNETIAGLLTPSETTVDSDILESILDHMLEASVATVHVYVDEDDHIVQMDTHIRLLSEVDLDQITDMSFPEGTTLTLDGTFDNSTIYSQINDTALIPVGAPELGDVAYNYLCRVLT